jgi:oxygen-dependent protoporphyrinogen oxidase
MNKGKSVTIIGAGIAGLTAAYSLQKHGFSVEVIEAASRVGGRMMTDSLDGHVIDCGAQFLSTAYPILSGLIAELGLQADFIKTSPWAATRRDGEIHKFRYDNVFSPLKNGLLHWGEWFTLGMGSAKHARALVNLPVNDYSAWADFDTQSATDWYNAQYGEWMTEYLIEPILEGFYFQSPEETSRALPMAVSGFLARGARTMTLKAGIGSLASALAGKLRVSLNERVEEISVGQNQVKVQTAKREIESNYVICAAPAYVAKDIVAGKNSLMDTSYASTLNLSLGLAKGWALPEALLDVYGLLLPRKERKHIAAIAVETAKSADRSAGGQLVNVMLDGKSGTQMIEWDEEKVLQTLLPELDEMLPGVSSNIVFQKLYRWKHAEPKSPIGRSRHARDYRKNISPDTKIFLSGDYMGMPFTEGAAETGAWAAAHIIKNAGGGR